MKLKMKFLTLAALGVALLSSPASAAMVDGVSVIVNKEPITLYDVHKYSTRFNISKKEAMDILVRQKLEDSEIKKLGITADGFEVDQHIESLAISNNMNQYDFLNLVKSKNIDIADFKEDIKTKIKREKLYKKIISNKMQQISESDLLTYYKDNSAEFSQASSFDVTIYTSANQKSLNTLYENPMSIVSDVKLQEANIEASKVDPKLTFLLNSTTVGKFTTIIKSEENFVMFYVKNKNGGKTVSFEDAKNYIFSKLSEGKDQKGVEEYFEKLKSSASITLVRAP